MLMLRLPNIEMGSWGIEVLTVTLNSAYDTDVAQKFFIGCHLKNSSKYLVVVTISTRSKYMK